MNRARIFNSLMAPDLFPFWIPLITHYTADGRVDVSRMRRHAQQLLPYTRLWMLAGTTGDGWDLTGDQFDQLLAYALSLDLPGPRPLILFGALCPETAQVVDRIGRIQDRLGLGPDLAANLAILQQAGLAGMTVCAPVGAQHSQEQIYAHLAALCEAAHLPVVIYQLPQVTRNLIAPDTFRRLLARFEHIVLFKDSGGGDEIAQAGPYPQGLQLVRGAEGGYAEALKQAGGHYDGWLLSTGNAFAPQLAAIAAHLVAGDLAAARALSARLTGLVERTFDLAAQAVAGSPFSSANRAADHLLAYGRAWRNHPLPIRQTGDQLPAAFLAQVEEVLDEAGLLPAQGYLAES